jgi:hypothetical protein
MPKHVPDTIAVNHTNPLSSPTQSSPTHSSIHLTAQHFSSQTPKRHPPVIHCIMRQSKSHSSVLNVITNRRNSVLKNSHSIISKAGSEPRMHARYTRALMKRKSSQAAFVKRLPWGLVTKVSVSVRQTRTKPAMTIVTMKVPIRWMREPRAGSLAAAGIMECVCKRGDECMYMCATEDWFVVGIWSRVEEVERMRIGISLPSAHGEGERSTVH